MQFFFINIPNNLAVEIPLQTSFRIDSIISNYKMGSNARTNQTFKILIQHVVLLPDQTDRCVTHLRNEVLNKYSAETPLLIISRLDAILFEVLECYKHSKKIYFQKSITV